MRIWGYVFVCLFVLGLGSQKNSGASTPEQARWEEVASARFHASIYKIFFDAVKAKEQGRVPLVFLDIDDTLIRTVFRYLDVMEALNKRFEIFPPWSKTRSEDWRASHHMRPQDIIYADSFEKTLRYTLAKIATFPGELEKFYVPNEAGQPVALQIFFEVFFDPKRVAKDQMYSGSVYFLNNLLSLMHHLGGKVVFLSGRADKYLEVTKNSLHYNGVSPQLLNGSHVLWYLKPSSGKINFTEDLKLDFKNDKAGMVKSLMEADPRFEIVGFVDNEARNVFSLIDHPNVKEEQLYFFRSVDATWSAPEDGLIVEKFLDRIRNSQNHFTQVGTYRLRADQAHALKELFAQRGIHYVNDKVLRDHHGVDRRTYFQERPVVATCRQLTILNPEDCAMMMDIICP